MLTGIDVSHHQGLVNWGAVASAGHSFAFCKATEGTGFRDTRFPQNWPGIRAAGMVRGAYHFLRTSDPDAQARHFINTVGDFTGSLAVLDVETASDGSKPGISHVRAFADEFRRLTGHPLIIYTGHWYWVGHIGNPYGADLGVLWHSEYEPSPASGPDLDRYGGWSNATFWQWTSSGHCPGVAGNCDLNVFYGTDLSALTGTTPTQEDTLSAAEVAEIKSFINDKGPYFAKDDSDPAVWIVYKESGTKRWVSSDTIWFAATADRVFSNGVYPDGRGVPWPRSRAHLDTYETVGPVPPGW